MDQSGVRIRQLARAGPPLQLQVDLVEHANATRTHGVAEALEATVDLAGHLPFGVEHTVKHVAHGHALVREEQVLHGHQLGDREAVVHFSQADLLTRTADTGLGVGLFSGDARGMHVAAIPAVALNLPAIGNRYL
ncbi:hypothetical protein D9M70_326930 [compost metagenome]